MVVGMRALDKKLLRDLRGIRGQALAIALVILSGVAVYIMFVSTLHSLQLTRERFYRDHRFAEVFASLKRAPQSLERRIRAIPGVDRVHTRIVGAATIDIEGFAEPIVGQLVSLPDAGPALLNRIYLRAGRFIEAGHDDEVILSEAFAKAHGLHPGDTLRTTIKGRQKRLHIVGTAISPEYLNQLRPGSVLPDFERFGILWLAHTPLATACEMEGGFNDLAVTLAVNARVEDVIERLDALLDPYGGLGAYARKDQLSHRFLAEEFNQLEAMTAIFPVLFLGVAAYLLNVVMSRMIGTQREQVAVLKAFGYDNRAVGWHYFKLVSIIVLLGVAGGILVGAWLGKGLAGIYMEFYRFPYLRYELRTTVMLNAALVSLIAAATGTLWAITRAVRLPPAQAMHPAPPERYRASALERWGLGHWLSQPSRMIVRHIARRPLKASLSIVGIALACAIMMTGVFQNDTVNFMVDVQFRQSQRQDLSVSFVEPTARRAVHDLQSLPGVRYAEVYRSVPVRVRFGHRSYRTAILGLENGGDLYRLLDTRMRPVELAPAGLVLTDHLGAMLGARPGDRLTVEVLDASKPVRRVELVMRVKEYLGISGYMRLDALNRLLGEGDVISGAYLAVDDEARERIYAHLKQTPGIASTVVREREIESFLDVMAETTLFFASVASIFAGVIAFGVVYNSARISLTERARELASLRVLGFTRAEIAYILLGELGVLTLLAIPLGFVFGQGLCGYIARAVTSDLYRVPMYIETRTYAVAALVVLVSALLSALMMKRHLDRLDLIGVLKTKE